LFWVDVHHAEKEKVREYFAVPEDSVGSPGSAPLIQSVAYVMKLFGARDAPSKV